MSITDDEYWERFQDSIVYVVSKGFETAWVLALDMLCFRSLVVSCRRLDMEEKVSNVWAMYVGSQGDHKAVTAYTRSLRYEVGERAKVDSNELAKKLNEGKV